jgi:hypothetical protein
MSGSMRMLSVLAMAAILPWSLEAWAVETATRSTQMRSQSLDPLEYERFDEPDGFARESAAASRAMPTRESAARRTKAGTAAAAPARRKSDSRVRRVATFDEPTPADTGNRSSSSSAKSQTATSQVPDESFDHSNGQPSWFTEGPNPGYHPARVRRSERGWLLRSMEPWPPR